VSVTYTRGDGITFEFGWKQPLTVDGTVVQDEQDYPRYDNEFAQVPWGSKLMNISSSNHFLHLDFDSNEMVQN
jgi:hypothetical protein